MKNTDSNKKSFFGKTVDAVGKVIGSAYSVATLPIDALSDADALIKENCTYVKAKDYYHNENINDNQFVLVQKNKFLGIPYESLKVAEGILLPGKRREGIWFYYEYSNNKEPYRTVQIEYKNGQKNGFYHEKKVIGNDVYITMGNYENGQKNGIFESYENDVVYEKTLYKNDEPAEIYRYDANGKCVDSYKNPFVADNNMLREAPTSALDKAENKADSHLKLTLSENGVKPVPDAAPDVMTQSAPQFEQSATPVPDVMQSVLNNRNSSELT